MVLFYIFVKKEGSNPFSSNGRVKIFSSESRKFFVKKQPHLRADLAAKEDDERKVCRRGGAISSSFSFLPLFFPALTMPTAALPPPPPPSQQWKRENKTEASS